MRKLYLNYCPTHELSHKLNFWGDACSQANSNWIPQPLTLKCSSFFYSKRLSHLHWMLGSRCLGGWIKRSSRSHSNLCWEQSRPPVPVNWSAKVGAPAHCGGQPVKEAPQHHHSPSPGSMLALQGKSGFLAGKWCCKGERGGGEDGKTNGWGEEG